MKSLGCSDRAKHCFEVLEGVADEWLICRAERVDRAGTNLSEPVVVSLKEGIDLTEVLFVCSPVLVEGTVPGLQEHRERLRDGYRGLAT